MHSIVVVKCKHSSFSGRSPTGGMKRNISFFSLEKREHHILEWTLTKLANTLKNALKEKFLWSLIDFFCLLHIQFSRKLNWKQWSFTKLNDILIKDVIKVRFIFWWWWFKRVYKLQKLFSMFGFFRFNIVFYKKI